MPTNNMSPGESLVGFTTSVAGTASGFVFDLRQQVVAAVGSDGPWRQSLGNFPLASAKSHRALLLERILDELPRYAEALKRLGEWTT